MALLWLLIASLVFLSLPNNLHSQSLDATIFNFTVFDGNEPELIYKGDAHIPEDIQAGVAETFIRLTSADLVWLPSRMPILLPTPNSVGRVLYSPPIRLWDQAGRRQANFQTIITGSISGSGDGMSFFIAPVNTTIPTGSDEGHIGLYEGASGTSLALVFAVEIDIAINNWDPNFRHLGINTNSRVSVNTTRLDIGLSGTYNVETRITYDAGHRVVSVLVNVGSTNGTIEHIIDLKTLLPEWVQVGISASNGSRVTALHEIQSWYFFSFMVSYDDDKDTYIRPYAG